MDLHFGHEQEVSNKPGIKRPETIYLTDGPWDGEWRHIMHEHKEIEDCVPEDEVAVDPEEEEEGR